VVRDTLFPRDVDGALVSAEESMDDGEVIEASDVGDHGPVDGTEPYTRREWWTALAPAIVLLAFIVLLIFAWFMAWDTEPDEHLLGDMDDSGSFNLQGHWVEDPTPYGTHAFAINLTLEEGDALTLDYSAHGPPDGIQVRLQHPLHPKAGVEGTGGSLVYASSVGGNGTIEFFVQDAGAYQVYFWHPGSTKAAGQGDDPDDHTLAAVSYHLVVIRAHRP
jgi:hypothetical protein